MREGERQGVIMTVFEQIVMAIVVVLPTLVGYAVLSACGVDFPTAIYGAVIFNIIMVVAITLNDSLTR
jgi:hypothetical protein